jgi:hypothetical protein
MSSLERPASGKSRNGNSSPPAERHARAHFVTLTTVGERLTRPLIQHPHTVVAIAACTLAGCVIDLCEDLGRERHHPPAFPGGLNTNQHIQPIGNDCNRMRTIKDNRVLQVGIPKPFLGNAIKGRILGTLRQVRKMSPGVLQLWDGGRSFSVVPRCAPI